MGARYEQIEMSWGSVVASSYLLVDAYYEQIIPLITIQISKSNMSTFPALLESQRFCLNKNMFFFNRPPGKTKNGFHHNGGSNDPFQRVDGGSACRVGAMVAMVPMVPMPWGSCAP